MTSPNTTGSTTTTAAASTPSNHHQGIRSRKDSNGSMSSTATTPPANSLDANAIDKRLDTVGSIRYNRSLRLGTGSHGTQVYQGFYRSQPAAIKRIPRQAPDVSSTTMTGLDAATEHEIQLLVTLSKYKSEPLASLKKKMTQYDSWESDLAASHTQLQHQQDDAVDFDSVIGGGCNNIVQYFGRV